MTIEGRAFAFASEVTIALLRGDATDAARAAARLVAALEQLLGETTPP